VSTAEFLINGTPPKPRAFDGAHNQLLTFELKDDPAPDIYLTQFFVYDATNPDSPLSSISGLPGSPAPTLVLNPTTGIPASPTGTVTTTLPATGIHTWVVRCVVNGGVEAATGRARPDWIYERIVCIRSTLGIRKEIPGESTQYTDRGWSDEQNRMVDALVASGGTVDEIPPGSGDWTGPIGTNVVERIHGATVPIAGALATGNGLYVSGVSALTYSALNLAGGAGWVAGRLPIGNIAFGAANTLLRTNAAGNATEYALAVNANIDPAAGIFISKLAGGTNGYIIQTVAGVPTWVPATFGPGTLTPGTARQLLTTFATGPAANWVTAGGDVSIPTTEGQFVVLALRGAAVGTAAGALVTGQLVRVTGTSAIDYGPLDLANANALANKLGLTYLAQGGAVANNVLVNNGTGWGPGVVPPGSLTLTGDANGLANANTVDGLHGTAGVVAHHGTAILWDSGSKITAAANSITFDTVSGSAGSASFFAGGRFIVGFGRISSGTVDAIVIGNGQSPALPGRITMGSMALDVAASDLVILGQQPFATATGSNRNSGAVLVESWAPTAGGAQGRVALRVAATDVIAATGVGALQLFAGPTWTTGTAVPSAAEVDGSVYTRTTAPNGDFYVRKNGAWVSITTGASVTLAGDVTGASGANTAVALHGTAGIVAMHGSLITWDAVNTDWGIGQASPTSNIAAGNFSLQLATPWVSASGANRNAPTGTFAIPSPTAGGTHGRWAFTVSDSERFAVETARVVLGTGVAALAFTEPTLNFTRLGSTLFSISTSQVTLGAGINLLTSVDGFTIQPLSSAGAGSALALGGGIGGSSAQNGPVFVSAGNSPIALAVQRLNDQNVVSIGQADGTDYPADVGSGHLFFKNATFADTGGLLNGFSLAASGGCPQFHFADGRVVKLKLESGLEPGYDPAISGNPPYTWDVTILQGGTLYELAIPLVTRQH
jgi:hypothetical protein